MTAARTRHLRFGAIVVAQLLGLACAQAASLQHDLFARPALGPVQPPRPEAGQAGGTTDLKAAWKPELRAVVVAGGDSLADVDGAIMRIGGEIDGFRLIEVREREAIFVKSKKRYTLTLANMKGAGAAADSQPISTDKALGAARDAQPISTDKALDAARDAQTTGTAKALETPRGEPQ